MYSPNVWLPPPLHPDFDNFCEIWHFASEMAAARLFLEQNLIPMFVRQVAVIMLFLKVSIYLWKNVLLILIIMVYSDLYGLLIFPAIFPVFLLPVQGVITSYSMLDIIMSSVSASAGDEE